MPNLNDLKKSKYLTKEDVEPARLLIISGYEEVNMAKQGKPAEMRYVLKFQGEPKPMALNKTNGKVIAAIAGSEEFDDWIGKKIVLFNDPTIEFGGEVVGGIRVRAPKPTAGQAPPPPPVEEDPQF